MGIQCDCSCDCDEGPRVHNECTRKARKAHRCCECDDGIKPGERYVDSWGIDADGYQYRFRTCLPCERIRAQYCSHGYVVGGLAEQIEPCIGFDYRTVPDNDTEDPMYDGDVAVAQRGTRVA